MNHNLCATFCPYYKPAKDEKLACLGFLVIERLVNRGLKIPVEKRDGPPGPADSERLIQDMCVRCPFYDNDCDFAMVCRRNREGSASSASSQDGEGGLPEQGCIPFPCGGFTLLGYLLGEKIINIDDIKKLI